MSWSGLCVVCCVLYVVCCVLCRTRQVHLLVSEQYTVIYNTVLMRYE
jgi:hypothetical protein